jgi:hypothetical protein
MLNETGVGCIDGTFTLLPNTVYYMGVIVKATTTPIMAFLNMATKGSQQFAPGLTGGVTKAPAKIEAPWIEGAQQEAEATVMPLEPGALTGITGVPVIALREFT